MEPSEPFGVGVRCCPPYTAVCGDRRSQTRKGGNGEAVPGRIGASRTGSNLDRVGARVSNKEMRMPKYLLAYHGGGMPETDEEKARVMEAWGTWYQELGQAIVDPGNPVGQAK